MFGALSIANLVLPAFKERSMKKLTLMLVLFLSSSPAFADLYAGRSLQKVPVERALATVRPGQIVVFGEQHGFAPHHENQRLALRILNQNHAKVSVGMEFFEEQYQSHVDQYLLGQMSEQDFLRLINWGGTPFDHYREQVLWPQKTGNHVLALNAPKWLTRKISQQGLSSLSPEDQTLLPTQFAIGNSNYYERFELAMAEHVPASALTRYFEAQSTWDEFMSHNACEFIKSQPDQILVIIVGDFHAAFGGGLPDRIKARGCNDVVVFSQIKSSTLSQAELLEQLTPHPRWGQRADYIFVE